MIPRKRMKYCILRNTERGGGEGGGGERGGEEGGDYLTLSHCRLYEICQDSCW